MVYESCSNGKGGCAGSVASLAASAVGAGAGALAYRAAANTTAQWANAYGQSKVLFGCAVQAGIFSNAFATGAGYFSGYLPC